MGNISGLAVSLVALSAAGAPPRSANAGNRNGVEPWTEVSKGIFVVTKALKKPSVLFLT